MKRTQLYLNNDLYTLLKKISTSRKTTISELVRIALAEIYGSYKRNTYSSLMGAFGIWKDRQDIDAQEYVQQLRKTSRNFY